MKNSTILKWVTGGLEALLGIPIIGGSIILSMSWTPLILMAILHTITIVISTKEHQPRAGNILGLITSIIGWIPFIGMILHMISALIILIDAYRSQVKSSRQFQ